MDLLHIVLLVAAGIAGGIIAAIAGGAAVITFPALLAAGLPPVVATAANTGRSRPACSWPRSTTARSCRRSTARSRRWSLASVAGGLIGAALLLLTPERVFAVLVPLLLGFATVLFAYAGRISAWLARPRRDPRQRAPLRPIPRRSLLPVSIYGGYFGAGLGVLMLGVLSVGTGGDYRSANVTKNLVPASTARPPPSSSRRKGALAWPATLLMMAGTLVGGLIGARLAQVMPNQAARGSSCLVGALLTVVFAWRYWF